MYRLLLVAVGIVEFLVPDRIVAFGERLAFENPEQARLRRWTIPVARFEGAVFTWLAVRGRLPAPARRLLVVAGLPMALAPNRVLEAAVGTAYGNGSEIRLEPWVRPATRLLGAIYLLAALAGRADAPEDETATL